MMQHVDVKLDPGVPWKSSIEQKEDTFRQQIGLKFKEETNEVPHLEHSIVQC